MNEGALSCAPGAASARSPGDTVMSGEPEAVWRKALEAKGRDWVRAELRRRPGQPGDVVFDVVFEEPLPTRAFCEQWCAEEDNRIRFPWPAGVAILFLVLAIICGLQAVKNWNIPGPSTARPTTVAAQPTISPASSMTNSAASSTTVTNYTPNSPSSSSTGTSPTNNTIPSVCAYATYQTAECKPQK